MWTGPGLQVIQWKAREAVVSIQRLDPDVPVRDRVGVILQENLAGGSFPAVQAPGGGMFQGHLVVDDDAVVFHGDFGILHLLAVRVELGSPEGDVIRLPFFRGEAGIHQRGGLLVDPPAAVVGRFIGEAVEHLDLIAPQDIHSTVAASLIAFVGHVGGFEFHMILPIAEGLLGPDGGEFRP